jgi:hypothetical protein
MPPEQRASEVVVQRSASALARSAARMVLDQNATGFRNASDGDAEQVALSPRRALTAREGHVPTCRSRVCGRGRSAASSARRIRSMISRCPPTFSIGSSRLRHRTRPGCPTSRTSGRARAGCTSLSSWTCSRAVLWAGRYAHEGHLRLHLQPEGLPPDPHLAPLSRSRNSCAQRALASASPAACDSSTSATRISRSPVNRRCASASIPSAFARSPVASRSSA